MENTDFKPEVKLIQPQQLTIEAAMASEAIKMPFRGTMHMDTRVIEDADFKSEVKFGL